MASKKTKGIILLALNHPYYGELAFNLAMSLKFTSPNLSITLLADAGGMAYLTADKQKLFDGIILCPETYSTFRGRKNYLKPKVYLNHFTPYDKTLFLDVDMIMTPKKSIESLMDDCNGVAFTMQNRGHLDLEHGNLDNGFIIWANSKEIKESHGFTTGKLYNLSSELIYWEKGKKSDNIFTDAQRLLESPGVKYTDFAGGVPDELPFAISMIKNDCYPHIDTWRPIYWESFDKVQPTEGDINSKYFGVSLGGNIIPNYTKKIYTNLVKFYGRHHGVTIHGPVKDKRQFLTDRKSI